jgi:ADP-heptose:LPS heptosyltransferase
MATDTIMIYRIGSLGDTIMALPAFNRIRELHLNDKIVLLTNRPVSSKAAAAELVLGSSYFFNDLINYPYNTRNILELAKLILEIRKLKIHKLYYLTHGRTTNAIKRDVLFFKISGIKKIYSLPKLREDFELELDKETLLYEWEAKRLARRLFEFGLFDYKSDKYWDLHLEAVEVNEAKDVLEKISVNELNICFSIGTKSDTNDWGLRNWHALINDLALKFPKANFIAIGSQEEKQNSDYLLQNINNPFVNLCGLILPRVSAAVLQKVDVFIGHDSGPMHLAGCVGTKCVGIFSGRNLPGRWYPRGDKNALIYHSVDCKGCHLDICIEFKKKCIMSICVDEVIGEILNVLNK